MKKFLPLLLLGIITVSCKNAWNESGDATFKKACIDDAKTWAGSPENAVTYCDCIIPKIKAKYPAVDEAMKQIGTLATDKDLQSCRDSLMKR